MLYNKTETSPNSSEWKISIATNGSVIGSLDGGSRNEETAPSVLVPGIGCDVNSLELLARAFDDRGEEAFVVDTSRAHLGRFALLGTYTHLLTDAAREYLGDDRPVNLDGHSFGGIEAQSIAVNNPDWVERLVLMSSLAGGVPLHLPSLRERIRLAVPSYSEHRLTEVCGEMFGGDFRDHPELVEELGIADNISRIAGIRQCLALIVFNTRLLYQLDEIQAPTLVLGARDDPVTPFENSIEIHERIRGSLLRSIEDDEHDNGGGHLYPLTRPRATAKKIVEWYGNPEGGNIYPLEIVPSSDIDHPIAS